MAQRFRFPNSGRPASRGSLLLQRIVGDVANGAGPVRDEQFFGPPPSGLQAVRFDSAADTLVMPSAALPAATGGWTVAGWHRIEVDRNDVTTFWSLDANFSSGWHALRCTADGVTLKVNSSGTDSVAGPTLTVGVWYFLAVTKTAADAFTLYVGTEAGGALTQYTGTGSAITSYAGDGYVGGNAYSEFQNGRAWGLRLWDAELSAGEIAAEFAAATAARTSNLRAQWLLDNASTPGTDSSGNGRNLTNSGGAWVLEAGPTLPAGSGITVDVGRALVATLARAPTVAKVEDVGRATAVGLARAPTAAKTEDVGRATVATLARAPAIAKAEDVGRALAGVTLYTPEVRPAIVLVGRATAGVTLRAPTIAKTEDVGRSTATALARAPVASKTEDVGRATTTSTARSPTVVKAEDVSRALATGLARSPTPTKAITVGRATATATLYTPTVDAGLAPQVVDLSTLATATATVFAPSVDRVLAVARVTARAIRPLDVVYMRERRGSAGWRSWRRA